MFQGSMVALVTPMQKDGSVDYTAMDRLLEMHIEAKTDAIVAVGTTGESATLTEKEHCDVIRYVVNGVRGRVPVIAGTGSNSTAEAIQFTAFAKEAGADACLLVTPYYNKPTQEGLIQHYTAISNAVAIPQILYNVPGRTACDMSTDTVDVLSRMPHIIGIKDATGDVSRAQDIVSRCGERLDVFSGDDALALDVIKVGGKGVISVTANVVPAQMRAMLAAALAGDFAVAKAINSNLESLHHDLFLEANPIPVKWALLEMGLISSGIRLPLTELSPPFHEPVRQALQKANAI